MKLTSFQRKVLGIYGKFHASPPTILSLVWMNFWRHLILLIIAATVPPMMYLAQEEISGGCLLIGLIAGVFLQTFQAFVATTRVWPLLNQIIDWEQVDDVLSGREEWS